MFIILYSVTKYFGISRRHHLLKQNQEGENLKHYLLNVLQSSTKLYAAMLNNLFIACKQNN